MDKFNIKSGRKNLGSLWGKTKTMSRYKRNYQICCQEYKKFLQTVHIENSSTCSEKIGVLVFPWLLTSVPWYSITLGLMLRKLGENVTLIVNDLWINCKYKSPYPLYEMQDSLIVDLVRKSKEINQYLDVIYLSALEKGELTDTDYQLIHRLSNIGAIRQFYSSGWADTEEFSLAEQNMKNIFSEFYPYIKAVCATTSWKKIILPGGLFLESGLFFEAARNNDITVITYDASDYSVFLGINYTVGKNDSIKEVVDMIMEKGLSREINQKAREILDSRKHGKEDSAPHMNSEIIQVCPYDGLSKQDDYDVTIFMNVEIDTMALGTHIVFQHDLEWLTETIGYLVKNTNYKIAVREHPMQRKLEKNELASRLEKMQDGNRVHFINFDADINSYNLIEQSKVVVVCTSTIGLEAAMCGKQVVIESDCYYGESSFVKKARSREQYFQYIIDSVEHMIQLSQEQKEEAGLYYYLTQHYGSIVTDFSPQPVPYEKWVKESFDELLEKEAVQIELECIVKEIPLCLKLFIRDNEKGFK